MRLTGRLRCSLDRRLSLGVGCTGFCVAIEAPRAHAACDPRARPERYWGMDLGYAEVERAS